VNVNPVQPVNVNQLRLVNVNQALRNEPRPPPFPSNLPKSMLELLTEWEETYQLGQYTPRNVDKSHWPQPLRQSLSKRKYLHDKIVARATNPRFRPNLVDPRSRRLEAAGQFDKERTDLSKSLPLFHTYLQNIDRDSGVIRARCRRNQAEI
jgi:hypothetical protein